MVRVRVELIGSLSLTTNSRKFKKGQPQILTNLSEIKECENHPDFRTVRLSEEKPTPPKAEVKKEVEQKEQIGFKIEEKEQVLTGENLRAQLREMKKTKLLEIAAERGVLLIGDEKKQKMIEKIMEAGE